MALGDLSFGFSWAPPSLHWPSQPALRSQPSPGQPAQPQPMNWLDTVESCLRHLDKC